MPAKHRRAPIAPTPRDVDILRGLFDTRIMTLAHVAGLYFEGRSEAAKKRVQKLKAAGLIGELQRRVNERSILFIAKAGYDYLRKDGHLGDHPRPTWSAKRMRISELTLRHELEVIDVKTAISAAVDDANHLEVKEFCTWPHLNEFRVFCPRAGEVVPVQPDAYIRVAETTADGRVYDHSFFLEVDRSHETRDRLVRLGGRYRAYYTTGGFAVRLGGKAEAYKKFPFRVLMVFRSPQRRDNVADELLKLSPHILSLIWLSTHAEVTATPLGPVWIEPIDRRTARASQEDNGQRVGTMKDVTKRSLFDDSGSV